MCHSAHSVVKQTHSVVISMLCLLVSAWCNSPVLAVSASDCAHLVDGLNIVRLMLELYASLVLSPVHQHVSLHPLVHLF